MSYKLYGSFTSPYVRKLRLLMWSRHDMEFISLNYLEEAGDKLLKSINPLNQIPVFFDGEQPIYDSRVIFNHLSQKLQLKKLTLEEENILSAIDTAMAAGVCLFSLRKGGIDITQKDNYYIERQKERIPEILNFLSAWTKNQNPNLHWNYLTMSLYSLLFWLELRDIFDYRAIEAMKEFAEKFKNCPGVAETNPPA